MYFLYRFVCQYDSQVIDYEERHTKWPRLCLLYSHSNSGTLCRCACG